MKMKRLLLIFALGAVIIIPMIQASRLRQAHLARGWLHVRQGDRAAARDCYRIVLRIDPNDGQAAEALRALQP
jgi:Tfp pilus assembly protein PilF